MTRSACLAMLFIAGGALAQEPDRGARRAMVPTTADIFYRMREEGCAVATDGCAVYRQTIDSGLAYRQQTLSSCPGKPRRFVCRD